VILEVMMIAVKDDGCQQEQAILHKARGAVAEVPSAPQPSKPWCLKPWNNLATQRRPHPQSTRTALDEAAPLGTASSQSYINHSASNGINGDSQAADIDMLYDGYFKGLFLAENGRSNEASTSQTNEVRWFHASGEFGQTIVMMVWHFVVNLLKTIISISIRFPLIHLSSLNFFSFTKFVSLKLSIVINLLMWCVYAI
jgi:hypothetical protein